MGRQPAMTKLLTGGGAPGSSPELRALTRDVSNNELVRTQTLVRSAIVQIDAAPFRNWYLQLYGVDLSRKTAKEEAEGHREGGRGKKPKSKSVLRKLAQRAEGHHLDSHLEDQLASVGDGNILEGKELEFYSKKIQKKKGKGAAI